MRRRQSSPWKINIGGWRNLPSSYNELTMPNGSTGWSVAAGELSLVTSGTFYAQVNMPVPLNAVTVEIEAKVLSDPPTNLFGSYCSVSTQSTYADIGFYTNKIRVNDNGVNTDLSFDLSTYHTCRFTINNTTLLVYADNNLLLTKVLNRAASNDQNFGQGSAGSGNWKVRAYRFTPGSVPPTH